MIAGEVGEDGHVEGDAVSAALVERVAGNFGDELGCAAARAFGHQLEKIARLGRGVQRGAHFAGNVILDGADEDCFAGGGVEKRFGEEGGGGFAVGAGDAGGGELALGVAEEGGGGFGEGAAAVLDFKRRGAGLIDERDGRRWAKSR